MIASAHISAGIVAGMLGRQAAHHRALRIAAAAAIGLASHVALDAIPHSDYGSLDARMVAWVIMAEAVGVIAIAALILRRRLQTNWLWPMLAGVVGSTLPDARFGLNLFLPRDAGGMVTRLSYMFHAPFHNNAESLAVGVTTQVVAALVLLAALFAFRRVDPSHSLRSGQALRSG